jgi:DNA mismatch repair protein MutH
MNTPPQSESELMTRAFALAGKSLHDIALTFYESVPQDLTRTKGWVGQLLEKVLGANACNLSEPDFRELQIELKTLPVSPLGKVLESTYICTAPIPHNEFRWEESRVWRKMAKMLIIPVEADKSKPLFLQRIGMPILWSPPSVIEKVLRQDWEELTELIMLGDFELLSAHKGKYLQIRPKAPNAKTFIKVVNAQGQTISIVPKGFYLRSILTQQIIAENYSL